jgi:hypothetical protein
MTTNLPTADQVIPLYDKYHIDWAAEEYIVDSMLHPRACASGICLIDHCGDREQAEQIVEGSIYDPDPDRDTQSRIAQTLGWPEPFLAGVLYGNDGDSFEMLQAYPTYRAAADQDKALYLQGYQLGKAVREAFYPPIEEDGDEEGW